MIEKQNLVTAKDFKIGLYTQSDIVNSDPNLSPNTMDIQWFFDSTIGKRYGSSTTNTIQLTSGNGGTTTGFIIGNSLTNNLVYYWNLNEASGNRYDSISGFILNDFANIPSIQGIRGNAADFSSSQVNSSSLFCVSNSSLYVSTSENFAFHFYVYFEGTANFSSSVQEILTRTNSTGTALLEIRKSSSAGIPIISLDVRSSSGGGTNTIYASSFGAINSGQWYSVCAWSSANSHIGLSVNLSINTKSISTITSLNSDGMLIFGQTSTDGGLRLFSRIDEVGFWKRAFDSTDISNLYAGGSGNTYSGGVLSTTGEPWYSFDFGATGVRWYTVAAGTGIVASSNLGVTFVNIATSRSTTFQYMDRSKNVLIMTSDAYDVPLYWAGSAGTFAATLAINSAPKAKYSINYQGFCILLNSMDSNGNISNRRFSYADENLQLTDPWTNGFDIPSSSDDEITAPFILNKFLYISTKYKLFRLNYTGGNPDWQYIQVKNFGYVPRTVKVFTLKQGQVAVGLDWTRRLRAFDGYDDQIISDNVYSDNDYCDFAMSKISLAGSGLLVSNAEFDPNFQEYRLNVAIGAQSTNTTHAIVLNARTLSLYPYSNQQFNTICVAQSAGQQYLMAADRSGYVHILNSGNLDVSTPINEVYDSPLMYSSNSPSSVTKNKQLNFYFGHDSCGKIYIQEAFDFSRNFSEMKALRSYDGKEDLTGTESSLLILRSKDLTSVNNTYQFRLTSSAGTANPWKLTYFDYLNSPLGYGRGK